MKKPVYSKELKDLERTIEQVEWIQSPRTTEELWNAGEKILKKSILRKLAFFIPGIDVEKNYIIKNKIYTIWYYNFGFRNGVMSVKDKVAEIFVYKIREDYINSGIL